ncbi:MAG TPA: PQQ-binding-like beta-propeller repeat protein [Gemmataceae bacterium]|nr:PQQ-binding-like beta-propeller repeat protein [Gemmataceae bacterium]
MNRCRIALGFSACVFVSLSLTIFAAEPSSSDGKNDLAFWTQWRGPSGQGYSKDTRVPLNWSETENLLWKTKLPGKGNSTPIIWGDRVFLTASSPNGKERLVLCVSTRDGKILWQRDATRDAPPEKTYSWNGYASASCVTDGKYVYAFFGTPGLFCYDFDGKLMWKHNFGVFTSAAGWGTAASPFLFEDLVIQNCDNDGSAALPKNAGEEKAAPMALVALDKKDGAVRWTTTRNQGRGFSTPRLMTMAGGRIDLVLNGPLGVWGYDPRTGKERWRCERIGGEQARFGEPMPVSNGELLFVQSGRPGPCQAIRLPGDGNVTHSHVVWQGSRKGHRDVSSPILWNGRIYTADSRAGKLSCYDLKTGKELYNERLGGKSLASPIAVRGKLLFLQDNGQTVVIEPGEKYQEVRRNRLGDGKELDFGASPAVADGRLFLRSQSYLYCIGEKK